jgi:hypothetical protein
MSEANSRCICGHPQGCHHIYQGQCRPGQPCRCTEYESRNLVCSHCGGVGHTIGAHF